MFTPQQIEQLNAPLDKANVKSRQQAGRNLSYIEGWHAIAEANRIFGFDTWDRETVDVKQLCDPYQDQKGNWRVSYMSKVRIRVTTFDDKDGFFSISRDGCGYGSGIDRDLGSAHESAIKEAETDAMKRALMTFGNPFGLALYDKEQRNVEAKAEPERSSSSLSGDDNGNRSQARLEDPDSSDVAAYIDLAGKVLAKADTNEEIDIWWREESGRRAALGIGKDTGAFLKLGKIVKDRRAAIAGGNLLMAG